MTSKTLLGTDFSANQPLWSGNHVLDDFSPKLGELLIAAAMEISELVVIQAQEVKHGDMNVPNWVDTVDSTCPKFIGRPNHTGPHSAASKQHGHGLVVVASTN